MPRRIILLTGPDEAPFLRELFLKLDPRLEVTAALDLEQLTAAVECCDGDARLIAFLTATIVPSALLSRLKLTPYNIHPGPPEYPGAHPECFAIWEQAQTFGVTAHEVTARVDAGPIVALCRFAMPPEPGSCHAFRTDLYPSPRRHRGGCPALRPIRWSDGAD